MTVFNLVLVRIEQEVKDKEPTSHLEKVLHYTKESDANSMPHWCDYAKILDSVNVRLH